MRCNATPFETMRGTVANTVVSLTSSSAARRQGRIRSRGSTGIRTRCSSSSARSAFDSLPILTLPDQQPQEEQAFASKLRHACHNVGFFYVRNHGVSARTYADALHSSKTFFALDYEQKMTIDYRQSPAFRGYMAQGLENTAGRPDRREQIEFGVDPPTSEISATTSSSPSTVRPYYKRLVAHPNQWPDQHVPTLRPHVQQFMKEMEVLSRRLMTYLAMSLDLPANYFDDTFGTCPNVQLKICHYPAVANADHNNEDVSNDDKARAMFGVGPHTDSGYLSLLLQDNVGGLQVQNGEGRWIDAPPIDGTIVVNLGEMIQLATQGYFLATPHRVLNVERQQEDSGRFSMPYFWSPHLDFCVRRIELPKSLLWERPKPSTQTIESTDSHDGGNKLHACYGENAFKSLARSHPQVMERHHPDLAVLPDGTIAEKNVECLELSS